ncbi:MAG TPA: MerR family transcriptional regulator [Acidimicrobiales bacterium]|nr:MerR family transcriptional regulator [Acidimicrobiales bacterium]
MADEREYRIDELAREAGTTVRNVRAYQDRGLIPPPRRQGRLGIYSDAHLARLRMIGTMLDRGYTLANIAELVAAWEQGQDLGALLGFEAAVAASWSDEAPVVVTAGELAELFGDDRTGHGDGTGHGDRAALVDWAVAAGLLQPDGDRYRVDSPTALDLGVMLVRGGVPARDVLATGVDVRRRVDAVARSFVDLVETHLIEPLGDTLPADRVPELADLIRELRPLAKAYVDAELSLAMERHIRDRFGRHLQRFADAHRADASGEG